MDNSNPGDFVGVGVGRRVVGISVTATVVSGRIVGTAVVGGVFNVVGAVVVVAIVIILVVGARVICVEGFITYPLFTIRGFLSWFNRLTVLLVQRGTLGEFTLLSAHMV